MTDKIKTIAQMIGSIFSAGIVLYGVFTFIATSKENNKDIKEIKSELSEIKADNKELKDTLTLHNIQRLKFERATTQELTRNTGELSVLKKVVTDEFAKENPAEKVLQLMREFEKSIQPAVEITIKRKQ